MKHPDRWWRPATVRRPAQRSRARRQYSEQEMGTVFDTAYSCGEIAERKRHERLNDGLQRLNDAIRASEEGDPTPLVELTREAAGDDLLDLADEAGATPLVEVDGDQLAAEFEQWLREQGVGE